MEDNRTTMISLSLNTKWLIPLAIIVRLIFFSYGIYQDKHFKVRYTDIDYQVFNDAARFIYQYGQSPFLRDTYRYTPLLAWIILPNHWLHCYHFSKMTFIASDIITGISIIKLLISCQVSPKKANLYTAAIWLLNPLVITISTRGNCETLLCLLIITTFYFLYRGKLILSGSIYGLSVHFKIYPIIYCGPIAIYLWYRGGAITSRLWNIFKFGIISILTLIGTTYWMYKLYGDLYLQEAWWYHIIRIDHRHNFSIWNVLLYYSSTIPDKTSLATFAFLPQVLVTILLCGVWLPYSVLSKIHNNPSQLLLKLLNIIFIQTFTFVAFNKVCTSQYFIWYIILLPFVVANTKMDWKWEGIPMIVSWVATQGLWLQQGYNLEFLGLNVFYPKLLLAATSFFLANVYIIGQCIQDLIV